VDDSISEGAGFGIFQEFRGWLNALQTFSTLIIIHRNGKEIIYIEIIVLEDSSDPVKHFRSLLK
jgi:lipoprotein signal peptidase